jgi:hypothetical protein
VFFVVAVVRISLNHWYSVCRYVLIIVLAAGGDITN